MGKKRRKEENLKSLRENLIYEMNAKRKNMHLEHIITFS
jgi:arginine deiminase